MPRIIFKWMGRSWRWCRSRIWSRNRQRTGKAGQSASGEAEQAAGQPVECDRADDERAEKCGSRCSAT
jgi:hypothetical protein